MTQDSQQPGYEFSTSENAEITTLASAIRFVGTVAIVLAVLLLISAAYSLGIKGEVAHGIATVLSALIHLFTGIWLRGAAAWFDKIVNTTGSDIPLLMRALGELRRVYVLQRTLYMIVIVLFGVLFTLGVAGLLLLSRRAATPAPMSTPAASVAPAFSGGP